MAKVGVINLGLDPQGDYLKDFLSRMEGILDNSYWDEEIPRFSYKGINPTEIAELDALILSPGDKIPVGLLDHERAEIDQNLGPLYVLIHTAVQEGVPLLGINAGHQAMNLAYGWAIGRIPKEETEEYQRRQEIDITTLTDPETVEDPIFQGLDGRIEVELSNNFAVLPKKGQRRRFGQDRVTQLAHHMGYPLISRIESESGAPVIGAQFNIAEETEQFYRNFFNLASRHLESR